MVWRLAQSLDVLRAQVNAKWPGRGKLSDGTIGDEKHATTSSDHNPHIKDGGIGVVTALDITNDPAKGPVARALAEALISSRDGRIKYIISNAQICSGTGQKTKAGVPIPPWVWRPFSGTNAHRQHVHISVKPEKVHYDSGVSWNIGGVHTTMPAPPKPIQPAPAVIMPRSVRIYFLGGLGGFTWPFYYSNGLKTIVKKAEAFGSVSSLVLSYGENDIQRVVTDAAFAMTLTRPPQLVIGGHSLGTRAAVEAVRRLWARKAGQIRTSLVIGFDGTWNAPPAPVPDDIPAIEFYNTTAASFLGHSKMFREDGSERGIRNIPINVLHQNLDDDAVVQATALAAIKALLA